MRRHPQDSVGLFFYSVKRRNPLLCGCRRDERLRIRDPGVEMNRVASYSILGWRHQFAYL